MYPSAKEPSPNLGIRRSSGKSLHVAFSQPFPQGSLSPTAKDSQRHVPSFLWVSSLLSTPLATLGKEYKNQPTASQPPAFCKSLGTLGDISHFRVCSPTNTSALKALDLPYLLLQNGCKISSSQGCPGVCRRAPYKLLRALHEGLLLPHLFQHN